MKTFVPGFSRLLAVTLAALSVAPAPAAVKHMVVIGIDGLSPDGLRKATVPNINRLREQGAWTYQARGVMPTSSSPNWASMIMGAGPEQHGVTSNDWQTNKFQIPPTVTGPGGMFPTIFSVLREQKPDTVMGVFHDWNDFGRLLERKLVDVVEDLDGPTNTVRKAAQFIKARKPAFTFIHLDHVDHAGHHDGHGTPAYYASVGVADELVGEVLAAIQAAGIQKDTVVLVTSDHGGHAKGHGDPIMADLEIPWILSGPGVRTNYEIKAAVNTYDTAATIAQVFGLKTPAAWIARAVSEAFLP